MAGPVIKIAVDAEGLARIGNYKAAAGAARKEVRALEQEAKNAAANMQSLPSSFGRELERATKQYEDFSKKAKEELNPERAAHDLRRYSRLAKAHAIKDLITWQGGVEDVLRLAESRTLRRAAAKLGLENVAGALSMAAPAAMVGLVAYESAKHIADTVRKETKEAANIGRMYGAGQISQAAFDFFQDKNTWYKPWTNPAEQTQELIEFSKKTAEDKPEERHRVLTDAFATLARTHPRYYGDINAGEVEYNAAEIAKMPQIGIEIANSSPLVHKLESQIEKHLKKVQGTAHRTLTPQERANVTEQFLEQELAKEPKLLATIKKAQEKEDALKNMAPIKSALEEFKEHRAKKNHDFIQHARDRRFSAAESFGVILWVGE